MPELKELSLGEDLIKDSVLDLLKRVVMKGLVEMFPILWLH